MTELAELVLRHTVLSVSVQAFVPFANERLATVSSRPIYQSWILARHLYTDTVHFQGRLDVQESTLA
jgi:hypothetical protein